MCGICGYYNLNDNTKGVNKRILNGMVSLLHHRGPDESGIYQGEGIGLGCARLSIIDLKKGRQPISNEDETLWIVYNGEVYNYLELRRELKTKGHKFKTSTDTEVLLHLYEERGSECLAKLNGQFAFVIWDKAKRELFMARDRLGIVPLFYTIQKDVVIFASEMKALFAYPGVKAIVDIEAIDQIFTFWTTISPKTIFKDILEVSPGHYLCFKPEGVRKARYWELSFPLAGRYEKKSERYYTENLTDLLVDATRIRLRADVPVGSYLSGGVDSSTITSIIHEEIGKRLKTFSIRFSEPQYDETSYQDILITHLGIDNSNITCDNKTIIDKYSQVIWHTEAPILRTAPIPLYLLSRLVRGERFKVVLAGDGADEFLLGYDIFKEVKIRKSWAKNPASKRWPSLLKRVYPYLPFARAGDDSYLKRFFAKALEESGSPFYSHLLRWQATSRIKRCFSAGLKSALKDYDSMDELNETLPTDFKRWDYLARAQYLESFLFLSNFLLSSQSDRVAMANSVEVRFPYLDHRIVEFLNRIPPNVKMKGLNEKYLLKKSAAKYLPRRILKRWKQPYRAPNIDLSSKEKGLDYIFELLSPRKVKESGYFEPNYVAMLMNKLKSRKTTSEIDGMALNGILSLQLLHRIFTPLEKRKWTI